MSGPGTATGPPAAPLAAGECNRGLGQSSKKLRTEADSARDGLRRQGFATASHVQVGFFF